MVSILNALIGLIAIFIGHSLFSAIIMAHIRASAKKKWKKNVVNYPYFTYPFFKKFFLLGLNGALNSFIVVLTFILNISMFLLIACCVWIAIESNIVISYIYRVILGVVWLTFLLRLFWYFGAPVNF